MYLGIDLGTSSVKILLGDIDNKIVESISVEYATIQLLPLHSEQDPQSWWDATKSAIMQINPELRNKIKAISFSGQMHGLVTLDDDGNVIRNAILWNDQRTVDECKFIESSSNYNQILEESGNRILNGFTLPKIMWMRNNEKSLFNKIRMCLLPKDYLIYRFSGRYATDHSDASGTLLYSVKNRGWSSFLASVAGIEITQLPKIYESTDVIGKIQLDIAKELGISTECIIVAGGADQAMAGLGTGCINEGDAFISLGTSGVVYVANDSYKVDSKNTLHSFASGNKKYYQMGVTLSAAASLKWWVEKILIHTNYDEILEGMLSAPINDSVYFLPYLSGERTPINDAYAMGTFVGLTMHHDRNHCTRAVIEGVCYSLNECFGELKDCGVKIDKFRISGGGAKSKQWVETLANILNRNIELLETEGGSALGALFCAMSTDYSLELLCDSFIQVKETIEPKPIEVELYAEKFNKYRAIYPAVKELFQTVSV